MLEKHHTLATNSRGFGLCAVSMSTHGMYSLSRPSLGLFPLLVNTILAMVSTYQTSKWQIGY
jgi:hypothetical protein